jgi:hypothetical protein
VSSAQNSSIRKKVASNQKLNSSFQKESENEQKKTVLDHRRKTALPKLGSFDFKMLIQNHKKEGMERSNSKQKNKIQHFLKKEKPELKEHLELFKEKASEGDVKDLEKAVKKKRLKNKSLVKQIKEIEQMLKTIEIKQTKINKKKNTEKRGSMMNQLQNLFMNKGGIQGLVKNIKKKANLEQETIRKNQKNEELRKKQRKAIETLIAEDMEHKTLEKRLKEAFKKFESKLQEVEGTPMNLEDELMKLIELKQMLGNTQVQNEPTKKHKFEFLKKGSKNKFNKVKNKQKIINALFDPESRTKGSKSVKIKTKRKRPRSNLNLENKKSKTPNLSKKHLKMKNKSRFKSLTEEEKIKFLSERKKKDPKEKKNINLFSIDENSDSIIFRQKIKNELKDIKSGKVNFKTFGMSLEPAEIEKYKNSQKGKSDPIQGSKKKVFGSTGDTFRRTKKNIGDKKIKRKKSPDQKNKVLLIFF